MKESDDPVMTGVKAVLERQGQLDSVSEITIYSDQCVMVSMPPMEDSAIFSMADKLGDYLMSAKMEQDGKALEAALTTMPTTASQSL